MSSAGRIGVVIPAASCPCAQLEQVQAQMARTDRLVLVWNGPRDARECRHRARKHSSTTWIDCPARVGAAKARNIGVTALGCEVDVIVFCDADDRVTTKWLSTLTRPLLDGSADVVGGALRVSKRDGPRIIIPEVDYNNRQAVFGGNCGITRSGWEILQGFDQTLLCCEDTDLAWRAAALGIRVRTMPTAIVDVSLRRVHREFIQRVRWGFWATRLLRKHEVSLQHLPSIKVLIRHKAQSGYASNVGVAAMGQWLGSLAGRFTT